MKMEEMELKKEANTRITSMLHRYVYNFSFQLNGIFALLGTGDRSGVCFSFRRFPLRLTQSNESLRLDKFLFLLPSS